MGWVLTTFISSLKSKTGVAQYVQELLTKSPELHTVITITRPAKSEEYSVAIATAELLDDTKTPMSFEERQTT